MANQESIDTLLDALKKLELQVDTNRRTLAGVNRQIHNLVGERRVLNDKRHQLRYDLRAFGLTKGDLDKLVVPHDD